MQWAAEFLLFPLAPTIELSSSPQSEIDIITPCSYPTLALAWWHTSAPISHTYAYTHRNNIRNTIRMPSYTPSIKFTILHQAITPPPFCSVEAPNQSSMSNENHPSVRLSQPSRPSSRSRTSTFGVLPVSVVGGSLILHNVPTVAVVLKA
ncbi:hypothetical protein M422DRAFT_276423 [Sphaerobolus stellatus SS14]|uniref:Uncharacterized protein n=1 Tax=Sphaerobolus stellatus (strain SS14) TaxID=990650 RepID=A0A0C9UD89_SPHS4|nr:hypothetical protein M422DRAFT_276752 [Sphaerobolus stellatus SS14]KIJ23075.1 hypothetical protein M422DRAFT_276423 [Sphaerobolus stellatus SS14]